MVPVPLLLPLLLFDQRTNDSDNDVHAQGREQQMADKTV